ncbi:Iq-domain [Thalictrum thalictroides]|uniref:Iq-domain n=1 Tax=Thalictrum thalictroides TaxID=46969 RepID=A0A7J6W371_THATH|nr:Iq-domain [Thalictrum thalictroides]
MGRSPGKWIKTVLFGKKATRSNASKGRDALKSSNEKEALVSAKAPTAGLVGTSPLISQPDPMPNRKIGENSELEQSNSESVTALGDHGADKQGTTTSDVANVQDRIRQEQAATKAQAAFRGYLARRAFRALMGIIRLQALVRGHLVRRQAVATLRCVQGIVKFQRLVRVQKDAKLSKSRGTHKFICVEKLVANSFISKLSASSPNTKPLCLQYSMGESNSAWSWLERWSKIRVWEPPQQPKKIVDSKGNSKPKRSVRKPSAPKVDSGSIRSTSTSEKPKRNMRKVLAHPVDLVQESSQNELEKVKRNLRKVSNSTNETSDINGVEIEKPKRVPRKTSCSTAPDVLGTSMCEPAENEKLKPIPIRKTPGPQSVSGDQVEAEGEVAEKSLGLLPSDVPDQDIVESAEKMKKDAPEAAFKQPEEESTPNSLLDNNIVCVSNDIHPGLDSSPLENCEKSENTHMENGKLILNTDQPSNEHQKTSKRRASLPAKQEHPETGLQNTPKLPSYMAATESVKAKLRAQGPLISGPDVTDQNGLARRLSLPSPINGKMSSLSPRTQRPQANGKGMIKNNRSILSSKDANEKVSQGEWKR